MKETAKDSKIGKEAGKMRSIRRWKQEGTKTR